MRGFFFPGQGREEVAIRRINNVKCPQEKLALADKDVIRHLSRDLPTWLDYSDVVWLKRHWWDQAVLELKKIVNSPFISLVSM